MIWKMYRFALSAAVLALFAASPTFAATITVTSTADSGSGTLRAAIAAANPGDTINFSLTYPAIITVLSPLSITNAVTISGPGASNLAISGGNATNVIAVTGGAVTLSGLTVENGYNVTSGGVEGGGIYNTATLTILNSTVSSNIGDAWGGGIRNTGTLSVVNSTFSNNGASDGGGILNQGTASISGTTFSENSASVGGAIYNTGTMTITDSSFSSNGANPDGGAIANNAVLTITSSTITANSAEEGGGIISSEFLGPKIGPGSSSPSLTISNSTIADNGADVGGGGVNSSGTLTISGSTISGNHSMDGAGIDATTLTLINSTISGNSAIQYGGGLYVGAATVVNSTIAGNSSDDGGGISLNGTATIKNTILAGNTSQTKGAGNCSFTGTVTSDGHNLSDDTSCATYLAGPGDLNDTPAGLDPAGLKNNGGPTETIALVSGPAIYSIPLSPVNYCTLADGTTPVATDQRGVTRPQSPQGCSIGAFEPEAPSAYAILQSLESALQSQISAWPAGDKDKDDLRQLKDAAGEVSEMLDAKDWTGTDGNHLDRDRSFRFFMDDQQAAWDLVRLLHDRDDHKPDTTIPTTAIQADLTSLAAANRLLATTAIAGADSKHHDLVDRANHKVAEGDAAAADGHYERAIDDYADAWSLAENAR